jgi:hypothetical protein
LCHFSQLYGATPPAVPGASEDKKEMSGHLFSFFEMFYFLIFLFQVAQLYGTTPPAISGAQEVSGNLTH